MELPSDEEKNKSEACSLSQSCKLGLQPGSTEQRLLESNDLVLGSVSNLGSVVGVDHHPVQHRLLAITAVASGILNQQAQGCNLEQQPQLCLGGWGDHVCEDTPLLHDDLLHNKCSVTRMLEI